MIIFNNVNKSYLKKTQTNSVFLFKKNNCIGYGGLVHINWIDKNAEISFIMNTELEMDIFLKFHGQII